MFPPALNAYRPSLRLGLSCLLVTLVIVTAASLGVATYFGARSLVRNSIRERLHDAAATGALLLDGEAHRSLRSRADEDTPAYRAIRAQLRLIRDRCLQVRFVYTMRRADEGKFLFVVDAEENPADVSHLGDVYDGEFSPAMAAGFTPPYQVQVARDLVEDEWGVWLSSYAPFFTSTGEFEGLLALDVSAASVRQAERRCLAGILGITTLICLLAIVFAILLSHRVSHSLLLLADDMDSIRRFHLGETVPVQSRIREIRDMAESVRNMKSGLRSFRRYVPAELVGELIRLGRDAVPGGERRCITTFFSDVRDFTSISEKLPPEILAEGLAVYFRGMTRIILEQRGTVDKFIGDAIMAFWGAPSPTEEHALLACRAALACQRHLLSLSDVWRQQGVPPLETRIGINTGDAIVGNIGYEERLSYTAFGDSVNLASRTEGLNKYYGTHILLTENTLPLVSAQMLTRWLDRIAVKGRSVGLDIFELLVERQAATPDQLRLAATTNRAMECYFRREWQTTIEALEEVRGIVPEDMASSVLVERCRTFLVEPPPTDWNGVTVMREK
jgi:class 3 adenylate cyclase